MRKFNLCIFIAPLVLAIANGYIIRLPCRRHGNFSLVKTGVRKNDEIIKTINNVDKTKCCLYCVSDNRCVYVNHKRDNTQCELLAYGNASEEINGDWEFFSTELDNMLIGPQCKKMMPCDSSKICYDSCESYGYTCQAMVKVSYFASVTVPDVHLSHLKNDPRYPDSPTSISYNDNMGYGTNVANMYGVVLQACFVPPESGDYQFYLACDDACELLFGPTIDEKEKIAEALLFTGHTWTKYPSQESVAMPLVQGQKYYMETRLIEMRYGDFVEVGMKLPGSANIILITHEYLYPSELVDSPIEAYQIN